MSDDHQTPDRQGRVRIKEEAARWFARMRGPDAGESSKAFEEWLSRSGFHREAYNRVAEVFALGKTLKISDTAGPTSGSRTHLLPASLCAGFAVALTGLVLFVTHPDHSLSSSGMTGPAQTKNGQHFEIPAGDVRTVRLADGSMVTLDSATVLDVDFNDTQRFLDLRSGRARFDVAHERRPFIVQAGGASVTARGTLFDVSVLHGRMLQVALYRGAVDVIPPSLASTPISTTRLEAGRQLEFSQGPDLSVAQAVAQIPKGQIDWPHALVEYDNVPLATVLEAANLYGIKPIRLTTADLGDLRVSGRFRLSDTDRLADQLAEVFSLRVDRSAPGEVRLLGPATTRL